MSLAALVMTDNNWAIGKNGDQVIRLKGDLARFRKMTLNHKIIYGIKTLATFPNGKPLDKRDNIIISSSFTLDDDSAKNATVVRSIPEALELLDPNSMSFVIGGESIYNQLLPYCDFVYRTHVELTIDRADVHFPNLSELPNWKLLYTSDIPDVMQCPNAYPLTDIAVTTHLEIYNQKINRKG